MPPLKNYYRSPELASGLAPKLLAILPSPGVAPPEPPVRPNSLPETRPNVRVLLSLPRAEGTLKRIGTKGVVAVHLLEQLKSL